MKFSVVLLLFVGQSISMSIVEGKTRNMPLSYPYFASQKRSERILKNWKSIKVGMSASEVTDVLGRPDEEHLSYDPNLKTNRVIGKTYWYLLQRIKDKGSQKDKGEKVVRISFNLDKIVAGADSWGIEP